MILFGNVYRLWIESAVAGTYNTILGQQSGGLTRKANTFDATSKDTGSFAIEALTTLQYGITLDGMADLPDANGFGRLESRAKALQTTKFQIRKGGLTGNGTTDLVFEALCNIVMYDAEFAQNEPVKYKLQLSLAAAPVTDLII
jgi:predicted secreted protein